MLQINQVLDSLFNKGFKAPKCKTLLKLATSRMKLLRNKRLAQLKQMRKELAQLLEKGQEAIAQIRVEQIIREQNTMEAYDKLEIFCELLSVRLPIIESQRECPLDLLEAVATVIFTAPRASDVPELVEIQTMFSSKYGPEFTAAAAELLPDCHVNRLVIELLSARAPSMKVKLKVMREVAEEHNVEWDATNFELENSKPPEDILDGTHFELQNSKIPEHVLDGTKFESEVSKKQEDSSGATNHIIGSIQMLPIPYHGNSNKSELDTPSHEEFYLPSPPKGNLSSQSQQSSGLIEEPQFVPFSTADPNRAYSPPSMSSSTSVTQQLGLPENQLHQTNLSRTKTEGSTNLQDIIEAAEAAAESAERAAQAARAAAKLARSRIPSKLPTRDDKQENILSTIPSKFLTSDDKQETTLSTISSKFLNSDAKEETIMSAMASDEGNGVFPSAAKIENSEQGVENYFGSSYPLVRGEGRQHAADEVEREEDTPEMKMNVELRADSYDWTEKSTEQELSKEEVIADVDPPLEDARNEVERVNSYDWTGKSTEQELPKEKVIADVDPLEDARNEVERVNSYDWTGKSTEQEFPKEGVIADVDPPLEDARNEVERVNSYDWTGKSTEQELPKEKVIADVDPLEDARNEVERVNSYDWTGKSTEQEFPKEEVIADVDPPLEDARNEVERVNSYDWTQIYTKEHHPEKEGAGASDIVDEKQQYIRERIDMSDYHLRGTGVGNPFRLDTNLPQNSSQKDILLSGKTAINNHLELNEGNNALLAHEGAPIFDGSQQEIIQRLPSLEDDPYYTYPNLFSKPSYGSALP